MKPGNLSVIGGLFLLSLACAVPGMSTPQPSLAQDPNQFSTLVAGTAASAATQTAIVLPAGEIPTQALSSPTPQLPATAPLESSTSQPAVSVYGTSLVKQPDGSAIFTDTWAGYQLIIPAGWVPVRPSHEEFYLAWTNEAVAHPELTAQLQRIDDENPKLMRLFAFDVQPGHQQDVFVAEIYITQVNDHEVDIKKEIQLNIESQKNLDPNVKVFNSGSEATSSSNVSYLKLDYQLSGQDLRGQALTLYEQRIFFYGRQGASVSVSILTLANLKDTLLPAFEQMIDQMILLP